MILRTDREWLRNVYHLSERDLPCNVSTVSYAIRVAGRAVEAYDALVASLDGLVEVCEHAVVAPRICGLCAAATGQRAMEFDRG